MKVNSKSQLASDKVKKHQNRRENGKLMMREGCKKKSNQNVNLFQKVGGSTPKFTFLTDPV